jgi:colanic acid/amylovoran biosynthesis glycosyltransferase
MKIAFLVTEFPSRSQTFVLNQITGLIDQGHQIKIFALASTAEGDYHSKVLSYGLAGKTTYFPKFSKKKTTRLVTAAKIALNGLFSKPRAIVKSLDVWSFGKLAASLELLHWIAPFLKDGAFDIVHCHFGPMGSIAAQCRRTGALSGRLTTVFHGYDLTSQLEKNGVKIYDTLFAYGDLMLPISNHWKELLINLGCPKSKIVVHRMGVSLDKFDKKQSVLLGTKALNLLSVARLVEKKGIEYAIEAVAIVANRYPQITYQIVGDGPLKQRLLEKSNALGLGDHVSFLGWMNQNEIVDLMQKADVLIAPSVTSSNGDQEGIPVVLMEALAMGLTVISTFHSGIPELVIDGESGFLLQERDAGAIAQKLVDLIENKARLDVMGEKGRRFVSIHYDQKKLNLQLEQVFRRLVKGRILQ